MSMIGIEAFRKVYEKYLDQAAKAEQDRKIEDGLLGLGKRPSDDPCHDAFWKDMETLISSFLSDGPDENDVRDVLDFIYRAPTENKEFLSSYWMLVAVHGLTTDLISLLDQDDAKALLKQYKQAYPSWDRLPVQKQVLEALRSRKG